MIADGRIAIDGNVLTTPATVLTSLNGVTVDGNPVAAAAPARLFRFHKPNGLLTTERDPAGRPTIYNRLPAGLPRLMPVGRLDLNTEGLLLMTTDGELKRQLELPATGVERSYRARAYGEVSQAQLEDLMLGIEIDGVRYGSIDANLERRTGANVWIEMTLTEGKNREVRRVLEHLGLKVSRLIRTRYGPFHLGDMPVGMVDEVRQHDLILFRNALSGPAGGKAASNLQLSSKPKAVAVEPPAEDAPAINRAERRKSVAQQTVTEKKGDKNGEKAKEERSKPVRRPKPVEKPAGPEKFGVGQRRRQHAVRKREAEPRDPASANPARPKQANPKPTRADDDAAPFIDRPKRHYRAGDRRPRPTAKRGPRK